MKAWLKGGLWGLGIGVVLLGYGILLSLIATFEGPYKIIRFVLMLLFWIFRLFGFFLVGALIGWLSVNWKKITGKYKEK